MYPNLHLYFSIIAIMPPWNYCYAFFVYTMYISVHTKHLEIQFLNHASYEVIATTNLFEVFIIFLF